MRNDKLCSTCRTGYENCKLDDSLPMCPFIQAYNGKKCPFYAPMQSRLEKALKLFGRKNHHLK